METPLPTSSATVMLSSRRKSPSTDPSRAFFSSHTLPPVLAAPDRQFPFPVVASLYDSTELVHFPDDSKGNNLSQDSAARADRDDLDASPWLRCRALAWEGRTIHRWDRNSARASLVHLREFFVSLQKDEERRGKLDGDG